MMLDRGGNLVQWPSANRSKKISADASLVAGLDPRIGPNLRLGDDPPALPTNMLAQAEPHIARHPNLPDILVATFQEGRYTDGGAVDCGYSVTQDGGLSWTRALIPGLTSVVGGPYYRASDPVAAIDLNGAIYLNTIAALDASFSTSAVVLSRSTNGGASFDPPIEASRSPDSSVFLDKNWMAVNTFSNTPTAGRIAVTYTRFDSTGNFPIVSAFSDDAGQTWSPPLFVTGTNTHCQGSQPVYLPDGSLAIVYFDFAYQEPIYAYLEVVVSTDGGASFNSSNLLARLLPYDAPVVRNGEILPSATGNRIDNSLYVVYQGYYPDSNGVPRILFTKSPDAGVTWSPAIPISDNPADSPVFNAAVSASPDGQTVTVTFYDGRLNNPTNSYLVDLFTAQSFDGGTNWQPNVRLTTVSSDVRLAPLTGSGYMLGDYLGIASPIGADVPAVPVWIDTRTGSPDPFATRIGGSSNITFSAWRAARFSLAQIRTAEIGGPGADPDSDGLVNVLEYALGLNPWVKDQPVFSFGLAASRAAVPFTASYQRLALVSDLALGWTTSTNLLNWSPAVGVSESVVTNSNPRFENVTADFGSNNGGAQFYRLGVSLSN